MVLLSPPFDTGEADQGNSAAETDSVPDLSQMTKAQLLDYADENGIQVSRSAKKGDILSAIKGVEA